MLVTACATGAPPKPGASVESLIGDAACDSDAQCHTVAVGAKACGGPQRYLAWSSLRTDEQALRGAAEREAEADRVALRKSGVMSNCAMVVDPGAVCVSDRSASSASASAGAESVRACRLRSGAARGAKAID